MVKVTLKDYALHRQITERSIHRYIDDGLIPPRAVMREGRQIFIDQSKADKAISRHATTHRDLMKKDLPATVERIKAAKKAGTSSLSYHEARTLAQRYKAALLKIELDEKTARLVEAEVVKSTAFSKARTLRDALLNIPDRISPVLAAETDQLKTSDILIQEIRQVLEELSREDV